MGALLARIAHWLGPLLVAPILNWLRDQVQLWLFRREEARKKAEEIRRNNDEMVKKLQEAKSEEERIQAAADLLRRG